MCFIFCEQFIFFLNNARGSELSKARIFVECHFVRFDSNQNSANCSITPNFEFHETFISSSHTEEIDALHFQIL